MEDSTGSNRLKFKEVFSDRDFNKRLIRLTLPIAFQQLMLATVAAADAVMLGKRSQNEMSAVSLATQIQFIQNMFIFAVTSAITVLAAQYWGKRDRKAVTDIFCIGLRINVAISVVFFTGCVFFPQYLMRIFSNVDVIVQSGAGYLRIAGWSYLLTGISQCYLCLYKIIGKQHHAAVISTATVIINIVLNAVLIFGLAGFRPMGVSGAATATLVSRIVELIWCLVLSFFRGFIRPAPRSLITFNRIMSGDFFRCFLPLLGASLMWGIGFTSYSAFMGHLGEDPAAANSVAAVVRDLVCCMCGGLATGGGIIVGEELGRGDLVKGKLYGRRMGLIAFVCGGLSAVLMLLFTPALIAFVKLSPKAREYLLYMMLVLAVYMIGRAVNTIIINGVFSAGGDTAFDAYSLAVTMWGIAVPLAALGTFVFGWHPVAVYALTCLDEVGKIPWVMLHFRKYKWVKDLTRNPVSQEGSAASVS
ncbi:MAG: MATE family efflux transporter [Clostridia bacterium]|nr:MATE family efflux transporter [Clostridia bacterium]